SIDDSFVRSTILKGLLMFLLHLKEDEDDVFSHIEEFSIYGDERLKNKGIKNTFYNLCSYMFDDNFYHLAFEESIDNLDKKVNVLLDSIYINFIEKKDDKLIINQKGAEFIKFLIDKLKFYPIYSRALLKFNQNIELKTTLFFSHRFQFPGKKHEYKFIDYIYQECYMDSKDKIKSFEKALDLYTSKESKLREEFWIKKIEELKRIVNES
ncbi:MAG: hypothetical protein ACOC3V_03305, partial [bacterium]